MNTLCLSGTRLDARIGGNDSQSGSRGYGSIMHWLIGLSLLLIASLYSNQSIALEVPDFEQLVKDQGSAVVKISVTGVRQNADSDFEGQEIPEQLRRYFDNLPRNPSPENRRSGGFGSGFIISQDGYIVTNAHVVDNAREITVALPDRREYAAELIGSDKRSDIALLKINGTDLPTLSLGDSSSVNVGEWVLAIGSPFGFEYTATQGIVSAVSRSLPDENYVPFIQTDAAVNPGNSGGPLFNAEGEVIGVNAQIYSRSGGYQGLSFAIPVDMVKSVVAQLRDTGTVSRGWLGVLIQGVDQQLAESFGLDRPSGALVSNVTSDSPAASAGVRRGDIILSFNGTEIDKSSSLPPLVGIIPVGDSVQMEVLRKGELVTLPVTIAKLEDNTATSVVTTSTPEESSGSRLGVVVAELNDAQRQRFGDTGVVVQRVEADSVAANAGILEGDILVSFNQIEVKTVAQLSELVNSAPSGEPLAVLVQRDNSSLYSALTLN